MGIGRGLGGDFKEGEVKGNGVGLEAKIEGMKKDLVISNGDEWPFVLSNELFALELPALPTSYLCDSE